MALFKWELRKIWRPGLLLAIALIGALFYWFRPSFYIEYFCNGSDIEAEYALSLDWLERYGVTIESDELAEIEQQLEEALAEFARLVRAVPGAAEAGITGYESFLTFDPAFEEDYSLWQGIINNTNFLTIQEIQSFLSNYEMLSSGEELPDLSGMTEREAARMRTLWASEGRYSILPSTVWESTNEYMKYLAVWCALSAVLLLSPTLVRDQLRGTRAMQWTSRRGRKILNTQLCAALLSGVLLTLLNLAIYAVPFLSTGALRFRDCPMFSVWLHVYPWFDWTYGQYLLALAALVVLLGLGISALTVFLSQYSGNYVPMLLKAVPLFMAAGWYFARWIMDGAGTIYSSPSEWLDLPGAELLFAGVLAALGLGLCAASLRRQARREL